jgi:hypothetical protein
MVNLQSNTDAILIAIPMLALLFAGFFRLDELIGKSRKNATPRRQRSGVDKQGRQVCLDPDGTIENSPRKVR